ncbi:hypothetical protein JIN85_16305 [Luteolibacter pohnpeiensis]|uniref:Uncharacterized protein n=1 Tax=Luteolibacter pohnpeiensis TaxID=454153 RepID=A0A934SF08_9BACT|nr:hypothetical protein [Luteolibacter pohnpeiensis]MBK1883983.1 hypothetical protein [Luteolibacter pohnpeiensis]
MVSDRSKDHSRPWFLWAASALLGLGIGYVTRSDQFGLWNLTDLDPAPVPPTPAAIDAAHTAKAPETPEPEKPHKLSFSQQQVDLLLKNPTAYRLRLDRLQSPSDRENWVAMTARFFTWDSQQQAEAKEALDRCANDIRTAIDQQSSIDETNPADVVIDYQQAAAPVARAIDQFEHAVEDLVDDRCFQQLSLIAELDGLKKVVTPDTRIHITTEYPPADDSEAELADDRVIFTISWFQNDALFAQRRMMDATPIVAEILKQEAIFPEIMPQLRLGDLLNRAAFSAP